MKDEILSLKASLNQLEVERRNLIQHFQVQEDNYAATFKQFVEKVELLLKEQKEQIYTERKKKRRVNFIPKFHSSLKKFVKYFTMITKRYMYGTKVPNFICL